MSQSESGEETVEPGVVQRIERVEGLVSQLAEELRAVCSTFERLEIQQKKAILTLSQKRAAESDDQPHSLSSHPHPQVAQHGSMAHLYQQRSSVFGVSSRPPKKMGVKFGTTATHEASINGGSLSRKSRDDDELMGSMFRLMDTGGAPQSRRATMSRVKSQRMSKSERRHSSAAKSDARLADLDVASAESFLFTSGETSTLNVDLSAVTKQKRSKKKAVASTESMKTFDNSATIVVVFDALYICLSSLLCLSVMTLVHSGTGSLSNAPSPYNISLTVVTELFTLLWMLLRTRVRRRKGEWEVLDTPAAILYHYVWSAFFAIDVLCVLPLELVFVDWLNAVYRVVSMRHLLRVVRIARLNDSSNPLLRVRPWFKIVFSIVVALMLINALSLVFWEIESSHDLTTAVYWAVTTITSVGFGDVVASSAASRGFAGFSMIVGTLIVATLISIGTLFLTEKDPVQSELEARKRMMYSMLRYYEIPWDTQKEVIALFPTVLNAQSEQQFKEVLNTLPRFVTHKIEKYMNKKILCSVPIFGLLTDADEVMRVAQCLKQQFCAPGDFVIICGDAGTEMYFIVNGSLEVFIPGVEFPVATLRRGAWFGEVALINEAPRAADVVAVTSCELLVLTKKSFDDAVKRSPELRVFFERELKLASKKSTAARRKTAADADAAPPPESNPDSGKTKSTNPLMPQDGDGLPP